MWERFSYYGMRALLILYITDTARGGLGFSVARAGRIYGLYTASVYFASLPGGWVADRLLGLRKAVFVGGVIIALGHFSMAMQGLTFFYTGLVLIVIGTGLLKPNISAIVGELYPPGDPRRDSGFSIYYMGINLGAFLSPLVCGTLGEWLGWHWGFAMAGVGMVFGLIQYVLTGSRLGTAGLRKNETQAAEASSAKPKNKLASLMWLGGFGIIVLGLVPPDITSAQRLLLLAVGSTMFVSSLYLGQNFTPAEKKRGVVIYVLFWIAAIFWSTFEQAGSSLNLFAERMTRTSFLGFDFPVTWFQSLNPLFIILLAPVFSWLWVRLGKREPSGPAKFDYGLLLVGIGFLPMMFAARAAEGGVLVSPMWLFCTYLLHSIGELCLSPVGLSLMTKLAPARIVGQVMGVWFLGASIGNYMGGEIAGLFESFPLPQIFGTVAFVNIGIGILFALTIKKMRSLMGGVH
jgi:POT family proton-dependent oligopeptide transporter